MKDRGLFSLPPPPPGANPTEYYHLMASASQRSPYGDLLMQSGAAAAAAAAAAAHLPDYIGPVDGEESLSLRTHWYRRGWMAASRHRVRYRKEKFSYGWRKIVVLFRT